jgi:hypothetical protein
MTLGFRERKRRRLERKKQAHPPQPNQILHIPLSALAGYRSGEEVDPVPGWFMGRELFCWCELHCIWNQHGYGGAAVEYRLSHHHDTLQAHNHERNLAIVVQGPAPQDFYKKVLRRLSKEAAYASTRFHGEGD